MAAPIKLVNLMKTAVRLRFRDLDENDVVIQPSGQELTIVKDHKPVDMAEDGKVSIVSETPINAVGIPKQVDPKVRYIVTMVAFESLPDRKDFTTPAKPVRDKSGSVVAYRCLKGHPKAEVTAFFKEAQASEVKEP